MSLSSSTAFLKAHWKALGVFAGAALALSILQSQFYLDMLIMVLLWGLLGMAWNLAAGYAGQFSVGNAAFFGIGAYTSTLLYLSVGLSPWLGMLCGGFLAAITAGLIGAICVRLKGYFFALATIAFAQMILIAATQVPSITRGSMGVNVPYSPKAAQMMFSEPRSYGLLALAYVAAIYFFTCWLERSKLGHHLLALRENEDAARALGVNRMKIRVLALGISAFITAIGGTFYAQYTLFIDPNSVLSMPISVQIALVAILGGVGTNLGPLLGALVLIPLGLLLRQWTSAISGFDLMIYGAVMMVAVLFFPRGILRPRPLLRWARLRRNAGRRAQV